jgi:ribosomal protein L36
MIMKIEMIVKKFISNIKYAQRYQVIFIVCVNHNEKQYGR